MKARAYFLLLLSAATVTACLRERPSEKPPIHLNPNMDVQSKYKAYRESLFFANHSAMRVPPAGVVAQGQLHEDTVYYYGKDKQGRVVKTSPVPTSLPLLQRGQERYNIYCSPCHSRVGDGKGIVVSRGMLPPPSFHELRLLSAEDGHFFDVMTNGLRNMPAYRHQVRVEDRWAIVAYIRALQRSQHASANDVPAAVRAQLQEKAK